VSCSVHDAVRLERRGIPTAVVGTEPFLDEALEQARVLGMPDLRIVTVGHPVQLLSRQQVQELADLALEAILARLTAGGSGTVSRNR
jgi:hypothetical protein